jgi:hypothetical protein
VAVNSRFPGFHIACSSGLNFHEAKNIAVPSDQVNLTPAAWRAEIPSHHGVAQHPQMEVSRLLSAPPGPMVRRNLFRGQSMLGEPVEEAKRCAGSLPRK